MNRRCQCINGRRAPATRARTEPIARRRAIYSLPSGQDGASRSVEADKFIVIYETLQSDNA